MRDGVFLFFPPFCLSAIDAPHLALPTLSAYLDQRGVRCTTVDLNVRFRTWAKAPRGAYDHAVKHRIDRWMALQADAAGEQAASPQIERLFHELAGAPARLLDELLGDAVLWGHGEKDAFNARAALPTLDIHPVLERTLWNEIVEPSIAPTVARAIEIQDHIIDGPFGRFLDDPAVNALVEAAARHALVGINVSFSLQLGAALALARVIRSRARDTMIALGGSQLTLLHERDLERLARLDTVDAVSRYEGEKVLVELYRAARGEVALEDVPSIAFVDAAGRFRLNPPVPAVALNDLPVPKFNSAELELYTTRALPLNVTRGCYWGKCTFCDYVKLMAPGQPRYLGREPARVVADITELRARHGAGSFNLITEALPPKWAAAFSKEILRRGISATFWSYLKNERKEVWTQDLLDLMSSAGIRSLTCGVESTSDRVLAVIDKGTSQQIITDNFEMFAKAGIVAQFNLIPDYPTTTLQEAADGIRFVLAHRDVIQTINPQMFDLSIQSAVAGSPEQFGIRITDEGPATTAHGAHSLGYTRTTGMTDDERLLVRDAYSDLSFELARYHLTMPSRRVLQARAFAWARSSFAIDSSCRTVRSRVDLDGVTDDVVVVTRPDFGATSLLIPAEYEELVRLLTTRNRGLVTYHELRAAYVADVIATSGRRCDDSELSAQTVAEIDEACVGLLEAIAETGVGRIYADLDDHPLTHPMRELLARAAPATPPARVKLRVLAS